MMANVRTILAANIKKQRKILGFSQEKLAEKTGLSWKMINSVEGRRTWISDKTLENLAKALEVEAYQLLLPATGDEGAPQSPFDTLQELKKVKRNFDMLFDEAFLSG
ncbi:MAG: helix-turn-helix domain-containing protein [Treponema sp.]|jgi:transcriptional regulator with XRE-family HTH domain|nr:helix-turn-helix domain-containing protein [Treponema sp.]